MESCPCGSGRTYEDCCRPLIHREKNAQTAEELLRSRYTAHVQREIDYIYDTTHPSKRGGIQRDQVAAWSKNSEWLGLDIVETRDGGPEEETGSIEFVARYREKGNSLEHKEIAEFKKKDGRWFFFDGNPPKPKQIIRSGPKIGRNDPCTCGSGKKFKKCCGA